MSNWHKGQRVVCVDAKNRWHPTTPLIEGAVYTVAGIALGFDGYGLLLEEVESPWSVSGFYADRFRPIDSLTEQMDRIEEEGAPVELEPEYA